MAVLSHQATNAAPANNTPEPQIHFSANSPPDLFDRAIKLSSWTLSPSKDGLVRQFTFPTFSAAWRFMSIVADECKKKKHHPSWHNLYNQVTVEWTTHDPKGLSLLDVEMAEFCDSTAEFIGLRGGNGDGKAS
ncbi:transcriptional coactivator/pterin dehydratase [Sporormia fimetaria CBS 119925]|uniref:4a-hydroxytetrahydrobiopterin dehydratase n=1 Tax=Sporormia fimetaria CBS 119925 TaxID=1340428 RepID=A0A6A6UXU0_9PLEO|nr:transcriptional coactivator/pterin dehydratase [Sporormia fimetaria CBS 119925]